MQNRTRNVQIKFWVTPEERKLIERKMAQLPTKRIGAYMRKMAIDGYIIYTDLSEFKEFQKGASSDRTKYKPNCQESKQHGQCV